MKASHNYVMELGATDYQTIIFCTQCGYIAYKSGNNGADNERLQKERPLTCISESEESENAQVKH